MEDKDLDFSFTLAKVCVRGCVWAVSPKLQGDHLSDLTCCSLRRLKEFAIKGTLDFVSRVQNLEDYQKIFPHGTTALAGQLPQLPEVSIQNSKPGIWKKRGEGRRWAD